MLNLSVELKQPEYLVVTHSITFSFSWWQNNVKLEKSPLKGLYISVGIEKF